MPEPTTQHPEFQAFTSKFRTNELAVYESDSWCWSVHPTQPTLGAGVLSLRRYCSRMADLTAEEMADLGHVMRELERATHGLFAYDKINYLALMMIDPHVHYHVLPRYSELRTFAGHEWTDTGWPAFPSFTTQGSPGALASVRVALREARSAPAAP